MLLKELLACGEYDYLSSEKLLDIDIKGISSDSRDIKKGYAFVCIDGYNFFGESFISSALERGAVLLIAQRPPALVGVEYVIVKNCRAALSTMLYRFYLKGEVGMDIYALTATNGKTSTGCFLREIFKSAGNKTGFIGTLGAFVGDKRMYLSEEDEKKYSTMTTPDPEQLYKLIYEMKRLGVQKLVIEASSHSLKLDKLTPLHFKTSAFMNLSCEHLDFHSDIADYLLAKCRVFDMSEKVLVNADDPYCNSCRYVFSSKSISYAIKDANSHFRAVDVASYGTQGVGYTLCFGNMRAEIKSSIPGIHTVYNSLAAASMALLDKVPIDAVKDGIEKLTRIDGRLERISFSKPSPCVFIDYAHTPDAMEKLLLTMKGVRKDNQRILTLFGCGGDRDRSKRARMGKIASLYSDLVIVTDDNPRTEDPDSIIRDIVEGIDKTKPYAIVRGRENAIEYAIDHANDDDIVLLVGKGHEQYEIQKDGIKPFSEKEIVSGIIEKRIGGQ